MQSLGETLRKNREERGYSIDQIAHETNISKEYLINLETEKFDDFPAEAYLIGFLRNYSGFLELDPDEMIALYHALIKSEEPAPIEQLVGRKRSFNISLRHLVIPVILGALVFAGIKLIPVVESGIEERNSQTGKKSPDSFIIREGVNELAVSDGDSLIFKDGDTAKVYKLKKKKDFLTLEPVSNPDGNQTKYELYPQREIFLTLFRETPDFSLLLNTMDNESGLAGLTVNTLTHSKEITKENEKIPEGADSKEIEAVEEIISEETASGNEEILFTSVNRERFTFNIQFRGYCLFRYEKDGSGRSEKYYREGDIFRTDVNRVIKIWVSNAGAAYTKINGEEINLGKNGEIAVYSFLWRLNSEGKYNLVKIPVD